MLGFPEFSEFLPLTFRINTVEAIALDGRMKRC